ncbi:MAG: HTTM domain-containing protein [Verrucomicrobia bacterium]|nr:HTTM domain-containing protein [Verrucomicrobiota bacterium]
MQDDTPDVVTSEADKSAPNCPKWVLALVGDTEALPLRVFESLFTGSFLIWMAHCFLEWREWLTDWGFHLNAREADVLYHSVPFGLLSPSGVVELGLIIVLASAALFFNKGRRLALLVLLACAIYTQGVDRLVATTTNKFFVSVYAILLLTPGYARDGVTGRLKVSFIAIRVIQTTLVLQYFASGWAKAFVGDWLKYNDVLSTIIQGNFRTDFAAWCLRLLPAWCWTAMQWTTLLFELEAPALFFIKKFRPIAFLLGIGLHLMIALMMEDLILFGVVMWSFYALFITADEYRWAWDRLKRLFGKGRAAALEVR